MSDVSILVGKILSNVEQISDDEIIFTENTGRKWKMHHCHSCCESVTIESIVGDLQDLVDSEIVVAEEVTETGEKEYDSFTWTFYKFATRKGYVDIRRYGTSNGYYSESVDFEEID